MSLLRLKSFLTTILCIYCNIAKLQSCRLPQDCRKFQKEIELSTVLLLPYQSNLSNDIIQSSYATVTGLGGQNNLESDKGVDKGIRVTTSTNKKSRLSPCCSKQEAERSGVRGRCERPRGGRGELMVAHTATAHTVVVVANMMQVSSSWILPDDDLLSSRNNIGFHYCYLYKMSCYPL